MDLHDLLAELAEGDGVDPGAEGVIYVAMFAVTFVGIFLRATQQRHVMAAQLWRMPPVSFGMAYCDVFLTANLAYRSTEILPLVIAGFAMGCGGSLGSMLGTYLHKRRHG